MASKLPTTKFLRTQNSAFTSISDPPPPSRALSSSLARSLRLAAAMSGDLRGNPTPWPAPPAAGELRLRSTTTTPMQSPTLNASGGTLHAALQSPLSSSPPPAAAAAAGAAAAASPAAAFSSSSQQTLLRGSSSLSVASAGAGANNNGSSAEATSSPNSSEERRFLGGVVGLSSERAHHLRVRKRVRLSQNLEAELGVSRELLSGEVTRHAALTYDVSGMNRERKRG